MKQDKFLITIVILVIIFFALNHVQSQEDPEKVYIVAKLDVTVHHDTKEVYT